MSRIEAGEYEPNLTRIVYVWDADGDMPDGFKAVTPQRRDEGVLWDTKLDEPFRNKFGEPTSIRRGHATVTDAQRNVLEEIDMDNSEDVDRFNARYVKVGSATPNPLPGVGQDPAPAPTPAPSEPVPADPQASDKPSGLTDEEWAQVQSSRAAQVQSSQPAQAVGE